MSAEFVTQKEIAPLVREATGIPLGNSTVQKLCSPAIGQGPRVAAWLGRRPLYLRDEVIAWAKARLRPSRQQTEAA